MEDDNMPPPEFFEEMAKHCNCCPCCRNPPCDGVCAAGPCDQMPCVFDEDEYDPHEYDLPGDEVYE